MNTKPKIPTQSLIGEVQSRMQSQLSGYPPALVSTIEQLSQTNGKHIRPTMILHIGHIFGAGQDTLLDLAAAVEMMHTATLVHDELVDQIDQPGSHQNINARFATSATVLAGDFAFAAAAQLAAATNRIIVMRKFSETLQFIVNGEITKLFSNGDGEDQQAYYRWIHAKTASLFELASGMAAALGSASPPEIEAACLFGYNIGMAFQITEHILDFSADQALMGTPVGHHLRQGMVTLPTIFYLETYPGELDIAALAKGNGNGQSHIEDLIESIRHSGAIEQAKKEAGRFLKHGLAALDRLPDTPERAQLALLAREIISPAL